MREAGRLCTTTRRSDKLCMRRNGRLVYTRPLYTRLADFARERRNNIYTCMCVCAKFSIIIFLLITFGRIADDFNFFFFFCCCNDEI